MVETIGSGSASTQRPETMLPATAKCSGRGCGGSLDRLVHASDLQVVRPRSACCLHRYEIGRAAATGGISERETQLQRTPAEACERDPRGQTGRSGGDNAGEGLLSDRARAWRALR